jgi:C1A family cysteine protease
MFFKMVPMKSLISILILVLPLIANSKNVYQDVVLGEIQKTFIKDYGASEEYWAVSTIPNIKKPVKQPAKQTTKPAIKRVTTKPNIKPLKKDIIVEKKVAKPLIDESDGWAKFKKRKKKGLIDDGEYVSYVAPKKSKKYVKKTAQKNSKSKTVKVDWMSQKMNDQSIWDKAKKSDLSKWEKAKKDMLNSWQADKKKYYKRLPTYKKNLVSKDVFSSSGNFKPNNEKLKTKFKGGGVVIVPSAFELQVKDQGKRPTCSAFASTRALEISLAQNGTKKRLSDQYIYYASKPYCQKSPCSKKGSWALSAFKKSRNSSSPDIPREESCPYSKSQKRGNETQIPLKNGCFQGQHQLKKFHEVKSLSQIINSLDRGQPVVSGFKLSPNFYRNKGVILYKDAKKSGGVDSHAAGHAILLVGYMKIPSSLNEGKVCFITANSWGVGWGKGGHACLSEKWVKNFRFNIPFLAVEKVI